LAKSQLVVNLNLLINGNNLATLNVIYNKHRFWIVILQISII